MIDLSLVNSVDSAIETGLVALRENPRGELKPGYRWLIYHALGPRWETPWQMDRRHGDYGVEPDPSIGKMPPTSTNIGHRRRSRLGVLAVQKILPIWDKEFPGVNAPHTALRTAEKVINSQISIDEAWQVRLNVLKELEEMWQWPNLRPIQSGFITDAVCAPAHLIVVALIDEWFEQEVESLEERLVEDPDDHDVAQWCCGAFSNSDFGGEDWDMAKERQFWHWWLTEAVPKAYEMES